MRLLTEVEPTKRNPDTDNPKTIEQIEHEMDVSDAKWWQRAAAMNASAVIRLRCTGDPLPGTEAAASAQYAYARYLMGIDDYYFSLPRSLRVHHRPHHSHLDRDART